MIYPISGSHGLRPDCPDCEDSQFFIHQCLHNPRLFGNRFPNLMTEVDINKKTENQAKMTKLSMEWKRLCKIKAKVQKCQSQSQYEICSQTGRGGTEDYVLDAILNPSDGAGKGKPNSIIMKTVEDQMGPQSIFNSHLCASDKDCEDL
ncbi:hypothetical protein Tco_0517045 [Tanacetum coccineum]